MIESLKPDILVIGTIAQYQMIFRLRAIQRVWYIDTGLLEKYRANEIQERLEKSLISARPKVLIIDKNFDHQIEIAQFANGIGINEIEILD